MSEKRADLYMGIGQAINELHRIQCQLMKYNATEEERLQGVETGVKHVAEYLADPTTWYRFQDLVVSELKE